MVPGIANQSFPSNELFTIVSSFGSGSYGHHFLHNGYVASLDDGWQTAGLPFSLDGYQVPTRPAPAYGEHTTEVLGELGYSEADILDLKLADATW